MMAAMRNMSIIMLENRKLPSPAQTMILQRLSLLADEKLKRRQKQAVSFVRQTFKLPALSIEQQQSRPIDALLIDYDP
uniref:Uncharacterized protein n=1 Tax=Sphaerodactylus townsendi TaxID=933632 RepID=A0ACB8EDG9_9SAUR